MSFPEDRPSARFPGCLPAASPVGVGSKHQTLRWRADEVAPEPPPQSTEVTSGGVAHSPAHLLDRELDRVLVVQALAVLLLLPTLKDFLLPDDMKSSP